MFENTKFERYLKTDYVALIVLVLLTIVCFRGPIFFENTLDLALYRSISPLFWVTLLYALIYPFCKKENMNTNILTLWGAITFSLFWGYLPAAEPELRYYDSFSHCGTAQILAYTHKIDTTLNIYLAWPGGFILHTSFKFITGLSFLSSSKILAIIFIFLVGIVLTKFFSLFFKNKNMLLCLFVYNLVPFSFFLIEHYSPIIVAYFLYLFLLYVFWKRKKIAAKWMVVFLLTLLMIIPIHPTTTLFMAFVLIFLFFLKGLSKKHGEFFLTGSILILFLVVATAWWSYHAVILLKFVPKLNNFFNAIMTGNFTFAKGIFHISTQPFYSVAIRDITFVFLLVLIGPSLLDLPKRLLTFITRRGPLNREDIFLTSIIGGSFLVQVIIWIGEQGLWGSRLFLMISPILSLLGIRTISKFSKIVKAKWVSTLIMILIITMVPLNFIAINFDESMKQTTASEIASINYLRSQNIHNEILFSDTYTSIRFEYTSLDGTSVFLFREIPSNPLVHTNNELLMRIPWTIFIRNEKTKLFLYLLYGIEVKHFEELDVVGVNKCYDNQYVQIYQHIG